LWPWSCYFGLGLKNLVLFTSLLVSCNVVHSLGMVWYGILEFNVRILSDVLTYKGDFFRALEQFWPDALPDATDQWPI